MSPQISSNDPHPRQRIAILDTEMRYVDTGQGNPIVFLHGNPTSSYLWRNIIPWVRELGRCLAPDLVGMGKSAKSPGRAYRFMDHARYLDAWFDAMNLTKDVMLVVHDWGSALGFYRAFRFPQRVKAIAYMEAIVQPRRWDDFPKGRDQMFRALRAADGERLVLDENFFVEVVLPRSIIRMLRAEEMDVYRRPFLDHESRLPTLVWPRELPIEGEPMHPLDEAEAFAKLAREEAKGVESIASEFGVSQPYVRQRMKLATLAEPVKAAYRQGGIDTATAEAFASVPPDRQLEVWQELAGNPQHAQHVRNVIAHAWIDAASATFDVSKLPDAAVSRDLFAERVLVERSAFMEAQAEALLAQRQALIEDGWAEVVVGPQADVQDRLYAMTDAPQEYDEQTTAKLKKLADKRVKLESKLEELDESDQGAVEAIQTKLEALDDEEQTLSKDAEVHYSEATKAVGTTFLLLDPDGRVRREYRVPRTRHVASGNGHGGGNGQAGDGSTEAPKPPTSDDLKDGQLATTFTHQALGVREAVLKDASARRRILAIVLHEKVRSEALAIRHDANGSTVHADNAEGFTSPALDGIRKRRADLDPLHDKHYVEDHAAYDAFRALSDKKLDALIDLLTVECITAHLQRRTELVWRLAAELGVEIRRYWRPDERWLSGYQKIQLGHLIGELRGPVYAKAAELKKKSELVADLTNLFTEAAEGRMEDAKVAAKFNAWLPSNLREEPQTDSKEHASAA